MSSEPLRILIVDDNAIVRSGLRALIDVDDDLEVVGEAEDGDAALRAAARLTPDVVLLDIRMPRRDGLSVVEELSGSSAVLMLTFTDEDFAIRQALSSGAAGYLVHGTFDASALGHMIRSAAAGTGAFSGPALAALRLAAQGKGGGRGLQAGGHGLSARQVEVMELIAAGRSNGEIAKELFLAEKTVKNHVNSIFTVLGVTSRAQAIAAWLGSES